MKQLIFTNILFLIIICLYSCGKPNIPKPYGFVRLEIPDTAYTESPKQLPYSFEISQNATIRYRADEKTWIDIVYPKLNAEIHCSYKPIQNDLRELGDDAQRFVYNHAGMASAISEQGYENEYNRVYGVMYDLQGNTASPYQFYLTDSVRNFFRAAVYFNCIPNRDSLAPAIDYIRQDVEHLIETFEWN